MKQADPLGGESGDKLYKIRHSLAHVMAQAVLELRPKAKLAFGPPIENGFYYDFDLPEPLTPEDLPEIEKRMRRIINAKQRFEAFARSGADAVQELETRGESFKVEYAKELLERGEQEIGFYRNGPFEDMCRGPHVGDTGELPPDCFAVETLAGAYWRGDEKRPMLTRIYALAFENRKQLDDYKQLRELAKERDHRKLGTELELYTINENVGPGLILWLPDGTVLREELEKFAKEV
jgi:threonyl-tRNA synthetase